MEVRSDGLRSDKIPVAQPPIQRTRLKVWFIRVCSSILLWTCLVQLFALGELWHPRFFAGISQKTSQISPVTSVRVDQVVAPPPLLPPSE